MRQKKCQNRKKDETDKLNMIDRRNCFVIFLLLFLSISVLILPVTGQSPIGIWETVDDQSGEAKSHVEVYEEGSEIFGKIVKILKKDPDATCTECKGSRKDQPILGMILMENLKKDGERWKKGKILDPENGNQYKCTIWIEDHNLKVKGIHWTGISRTQTWHRVK